MENKAYPGKILEFNVVKKFSADVDKTIEQLMYTDDDQWGTGIDTFEEMIDDKLVEIDMLLSKIRFATDVTQGLRVEKDQAIKEEIERAGEHFRRLKHSKIREIYI